MSQFSPSTFESFAYFMFKELNDTDFEEFMRTKVQWTGSIDSGVTWTKLWKAENYTKCIASLTNIPIPQQ